MLLEVVSLRKPLPPRASGPSTISSHYLLDHLGLAPNHCREPSICSSLSSTLTIPSNQASASRLSPPQASPPTSAQTTPLRLYALASRDKRKGVRQRSIRQNKRQKKIKRKGVELTGGLLEPSLLALAPPASGLWPTRVTSRLAS